MRVSERGRMREGGEEREGGQEESAKSVAISVLCARTNMHAGHNEPSIRTQRTDQTYTPNQPFIHNGPIIHTHQTNHSYTHIRARTHNHTPETCGSQQVSSAISTGLF